MRSIMKNLRLKSNLTQQQVADKLSIDRSSYANIELGNKNPSFRLALNIKKVFQYDNDDIFLDV